MTEVSYQTKKYTLEDSETVLEGLLRQKIAYPHSCKSGVCQSCLSELVAGSMDPVWQSGLDSQLIAQNYFLPCLCRLKEAITVCLATQYYIQKSRKLSICLFLVQRYCV
ncbi:2Fe-2S iron-sulfur cluster-binding protein [Rickettsiella massiliensis]|uniref:2Fe-2S iron-sulfur cluster-binding protein n=1 Tax=Rickettsiella massiliensis TaxID=676517 RepID=UPI0002EA8637|nr:2Fe-2S iron-sulfur cluster binding domain-containing protein [Rickettsiella massiliensis]